MLTAGPAASAWATAKLRLVNARPGTEAVALTANGAPAGDRTAFGGATPYASVQSGSVKIALDGVANATATEHLADGARYTAVASARGLKVYRDAEARGRRARLRIVHAAPELGSPNILLGKRTIAEDLAFRRATPYLTVAPGSYALKVARPGASGAIFQKSVTLSAGSATTAVLAGSGGAAGRLIVVTDDTVTPAGAPETGLGGLAAGAGNAQPWLLAALAAALAGLLGGVAQLALARRSGRR